ncbi:hypothetical protein V8E55_005131 [Tylopilus felleus]
MNVFVDQLQHKASALLAAYALATCLKYSDMKESVKNNEDLPKYIVGMLRLDYFDDAVGQVEGFQIFGDIMRRAALREKIKYYNITEVLNAKLGAGKLKEIQTSLICLDIFRSFGRSLSSPLSHRLTLLSRYLSLDPDGPWTRELVAKSLDHLRNPEWGIQKAGVTILSALAQTAGYTLISSTSPTVPRSASLGETQAREGTSRPSRVQTMSPDSPSKPPSSIFGPACALPILAQNSEYSRTRDTLQYGNLKHLHLSGNLVDETETLAWRVKTPIRGESCYTSPDVIDMIDKMIKAVDEELSEEGLVSIGDTVLPHIQHWDRLAILVRDRSIATVTILPLVLGVSALTIIAIAVITPIYISFETYKWVVIDKSVICLLIGYRRFFRRLVVRYQRSRILDRLRGRDSAAPLNRDGHESDHGENQDGSGGQGAEAVPVARGNEGAL